jgi:FkbM family methyltransferase
MGESMNEKIMKLFRTLQSEFPFLKDAKDGLYFFARRRLAIPHERDFKALALIPKSAEGCFVDIGANQGQSIESILLARPNAEIVSFEANPGLAQKLVRRYQERHSVQVRTCGLSDAPGTFKLFVPSYKGFVYDALASLDRAYAVSGISEKWMFGFDPARLSVAELQCSLDTLDAQQLAPIFVKLDVQGHEYSVLSGGKETLRRYEPILLVEAFRDDPRTVQLIKELGYEEYYFDGSSLRKGAPSSSPNSFLLTPGRFKFLIGRKDSASAAFAPQAARRSTVANRSSDPTRESSGTYTA